MEEIDRNLQEIIELQLEKTEVLSGKIVQDLKNPRYTSGRLIKYGDRPLMILETVYESDNYEILLYPENLKKHIKLKEGSFHPTAMVKTNNEIDISSPFSIENSKLTEISLKMILLHEEEIREFCKKYLFAGGDEKVIRVVKRPKNWN